VSEESSASADGSLRAKVKQRVRSVGGKVERDAGIYAIFFCVWAIPTVNSLGDASGRFGLLGGWPGTLVGNGGRIAVMTLGAVCLSIALVGRRELGLFLPRDEVEARGPRGQWRGIAVMAVLVFAAAGAVRLALELVGVPASAFDGVVSVSAIAVQLGSAPMEEMSCAAALVLMERGGWTQTQMLIAVVIVRAAYHAHLGLPAVFASVVLATGMVLVFQRYRRVGPIIAVHAFINAGSMIKEFVMAHL
jgi:membrane protease YdiL (CAAX protease family)